MKYLKLILRNIGRNPLRSLLTSLVTIVLVCVVTMVWSTISMKNPMMTAHSADHARLTVTS